MGLSHCCISSEQTLKTFILDRFSRMSLKKKKECPWKIDTAFPLWRRDFKEEDFKKLGFHNLSLSV